MLPGNTIEFPHMTYRLIPEILDAVDVVRLVGEYLAVIDSVVLEFRDIQHVYLGQPLLILIFTSVSDCHLHDALAGTGVAKDIVWWTPEEIDEWKNVRSHFISTVLREGKVLYEKPA